MIWKSIVLTNASRSTKKFLKMVNGVAGFHCLALFRSFDIEVVKNLSGLVFISELCWIDLKAVVKENNKLARLLKWEGRYLRMGRMG